MFFFKSSRNGPVCVEKSGTKRLQKVAKPRNDFNSVAFFGEGAFFKASIFDGSLDMPCFPTTTPKNEICSFRKSHFSKLNLSPSDKARLNKASSLSICSASVVL